MYIRNIADIPPKWKGIRNADAKTRGKRCSLHQYQEANRQADRYFWEIRLQFEYKGQKGPLWGWLHIDPETLTDHALKTGWSCQVISQEEGGDYLAR